MTFEPMLIDADTAAVVRALGIPPCPEVLADFMRETARPEPDVRRLANLISADPGLAAAVIRTVNSPLFGPGAHASTVSGALAALGLRRCANLIAGLLLRKAFSTLGDPSMLHFWDASARHADWMTRLGRALRGVDASEAHTFALFRDCGVPILVRRFFDYGELYTGVHRAGLHELDRMEFARYGCDHATIGALLAHDWQLPETIWGAIQCHHLETVSAVISPAARRLAAVSVLAECLERADARPVQGPSDYWTVKQSQAGELLGIDGPAFDQLRAQLAAPVPD